MKRENLFLMAIWQIIITTSKEKLIKTTTMNINYQDIVKYV